MKIRMILCSVVMLIITVISCDVAMADVFSCSDYNNNRLKCITNSYCVWSGGETGGYCSDAPSGSYCSDYSSCVDTGYRCTGTDTYTNNLVPLGKYGYSYEDEWGNITCTSKNCPHGWTTVAKGNTTEWACFAKATKRDPDENGEYVANGGVYGYAVCGNIINEEQCKSTPGCKYQDSICHGVDDGEYSDGNPATGVQQCPSEFPHSYPHANSIDKCFVIISDDGENTDGFYYGGEWQTCENSCEYTTSECTLGLANNGTKVICMGANGCPYRYQLIDGKCVECTENEYYDTPSGECNLCQTGEIGNDILGTSYGTGFESCSWNCVDAGKIYSATEMEDNGNQIYMVASCLNGGLVWKKDQCRAAKCKPGSRPYNFSIDQQNGQCYEYHGCDLCWNSQFSPEGVRCIACYNGTVTDSSGDPVKYGGVNCSCNPGYYKTTKESGSCTECPNGYYCPGGDSDKIKCPGDLGTDPSDARYAGAACQNNTCLDASNSGGKGTMAKTVAACGVNVPAHKYVGCGTGGNSCKLIDCPEGYYCPDDVKYYLRPYNGNDNTKCACDNGDRGPHMCSLWPGDTNIPKNKAYCPDDGLAKPQKCMPWESPINTKYTTETGRPESEAGRYHDCAPCIWAENVTCPTGSYQCAGDTECHTAPEGYYSDGAALYKCPGYSISDPGARHKGQCYIGGPKMTFADSYKSYELPVKVYYWSM